MDATQANEMPKINAESKVKMEVNIPKPLDDKVRQLAKADGWNLAEFYRLLIVNGLAVYAENSNKLLVNERLRNKLGQTDDDGNG